MFSSRAKKRRSYCQVCVQCEPTLRIKGEMFSLRQLEVVAVLGTWDPCLTAGIGMEPAAPLRARCCFIYLKAQVTFLEERRRDLPLKAVCVPSLLFCHITPTERRERTMRLPSSLSFNRSMNVPPQDSTVWLHSRGYILWCSYIYIFFFSCSQFLTSKCEVWVT